LTHEQVLKAKDFSSDNIERLAAFELKRVLRGFNSGEMLAKWGKSADERGCGAVVHDRGKTMITTVYAGPKSKLVGCDDDRPAEK
jgi:hypothetical protein